MRAILLTLAFLFSSLPLVSAQAPAAVLLTTHRLEANGAVCSGTAIAPHALLTAAHCEFTTSVKVDDAEVDTEIKAVINDGNDHVILLTGGDEFEDFASFAEEAQTPGDEIWVRGNPAGLNQLVRRGTYAGPEIGAHGAINIYDYNGFYGDSGAAVFNAAGQIVDVIDAGIAIPGPDGTKEIFQAAIGYGLRFSHAQLASAQSLRFDR